ncbi:MAG: AMP-dependent synthetase/ligase [bacterium]
MEFATVNSMYERLFRVRAHLPAYHVKRNGAWEAVSWQAYREKVRDFALGLMALGMEPGDPVSILGATREEWDLADKAVQSAGGVAVGIYHSNTPQQVHHILDHSESGFLVLENELQWRKVEPIRRGLPRLRRTIAMDSAGIQDPEVVPFEDVLRLGRKQEPTRAEELARRSAAVKPDDTAIIFYTSGTTGPPKGAMLTHKNILSICGAIRNWGVLTPQETTVIWLPMPHIYGRLMALASAYCGTVGWYAESVERLMANLQEIRPTIFYSVPRIFEKVHTQLIGQAAGGADGLTPERIRQVFGGRIRILLSGGAPIAKEILEFFHAAGILPLEIYGITETLMCAINRPEKYRFGSVGSPPDGVELRIGADGEILVRSDMVFKGYLKDAAKTREALSKDGWYATGDIGRIDDDGFLWITDRKKDILITAGGKNVAPQNIENLMKTSPYISQVMVYGDRKPYLTALVTLDADEIRKWASSQGIDGADLKALCSHSRVVDLVESVVREKNEELASYEQIKYVRILPEEFSQESGTLTATLKLRRREVVKRYGDLLEGMYKGGEHGKGQQQ